MGKTKGASNKDVKAAALVLTPEERIILLADLILEVIAIEEVARAKYNNAVANY